MRTHLLLLATLLCYSSFAQNITWSAPVSVAASSSGNMHPRITLDASGNPLVLWGNSVMGGQAVFARWNGSAFAMPVVLNPMSLPVSTFSWAGPDIASFGDTVYAVMKAEPEDTGRVYLVRSFDGGQNWSAPIAVTVITDTSRFPTITTNVSGSPIVGYMQFGANFTEPRYVVSKSNNFGNTFNPPLKASTELGEVCDCCPSSLVCTGNTIVMLYRNNLSNIRTIWAGISTDGGSTFNDSLEIDNTNWIAMACPASGPDGVVLGDTLFTVFSSSSPSRVYFSKSTISNPQLIASNQFVANFTGLNQQDYPRIANAGYAAAILWKQLANGDSRLCISFTDSITEGFPAAYDTVATDGAINGDIALAAGSIHVVWQDVISGTVMYRKGIYGTTSIEETAKEAGTLEIYPNPASDHFTISNNAIRSVSECVLIDNSGKRISVDPLYSGNGISFKLTGIAAGIYTLQVRNREGKNFSGKLIIK